MYDNKMDLAVYDKIRGGYRVFIGDLGSRIGKYEIEKEFKQFGPITDTWVARNPPGFAFLVFKYAEDAESAVRKVHGRRLNGRRIRVEHARPFEERRRLQQEARRDPRPRYSRKSGIKLLHFVEIRSRSRDRHRSRSRDRKRSRSKDRRSKSRDRKRSRSTSHSRTRKSKKAKRSRSRSRSESASRKRKNSRRSSSGERRSKSGSPTLLKNGTLDREKSKSRSQDRSLDRKLSDTDEKGDRRSPSVTKSENDNPSSSKTAEEIVDKTNDRGDDSDD